jgi:hypothetical protein
VLCLLVDLAFVSLPHQNACLLGTAGLFGFLWGSGMPAYIVLKPFNVHLMDIFFLF